MTEPTFDPAPDDIPSRDIPSTFSVLTDPFLVWTKTFRGQLSSSVAWFVAQVSAVAASASAAAGSVTAAATQVGFAAEKVTLAADQVGLATTQAGNAAASAAAAAATANAVAWVSAASYTAIISNVISPVDFGTYRAKTTHTGVATDPSADATNWDRISAKSFVSPAFTGTPTAPTAALGTNTTQLATTEFVLANGSSSSVAALTPAATVDISLLSADYFTLALNQNTTLTMSNVGASVDTFNLAVTGHTISGGGFAINVGAYDGAFFDASAQNAGPEALFFKPDGTKVYIANDATNYIFQYILSTPWDLTTALYNNVSAGIGGTQAVISGLFFKPDGTKMYIIGSSPDTIHQYTLSTAWDLSTYSYDNVSLLVTSQGSDPRGLFFKPDGTKMYMADGWLDRIFQYTLSTAWNLATASYDNVSFSVGSEGNPQSVFFKPDGTEMFILEDTSDTVRQYNLSTAWNLATASYASVSFSVTSQDANPRGMFFNGDGQKMYMIGNTNKTVYEYLTTDLVSATTTYPSSFNFPNGEIPAVALDGELNILKGQTTDGGSSWNVHQLGADFS
tara:strand:- start:3256 stop:4950 length:1695 start_codon:yes stop_codon:yes gene_type:complete